jgi:hypothetical protein
VKQEAAWPQMTRRLPHPVQTRRACQSITVVSAP